MILAYTNQDVRVTKTYLGDTTNQLGQPFPITPRNVASFNTVYEFQDGALKGARSGAGIIITARREPMTSPALISQR